MISYKFQISNSKLQIILKSQNSNSKQIFNFSESSRFHCFQRASFCLSSDRRNHFAISQNKFGSLEFGIWILFVICFLVLGILDIQRLNYILAIWFQFFNIWDSTLVILKESISYALRLKPYTSTFQ